MLAATTTVVAAASAQQVQGNYLIANLCAPSDMIAEPGAAVLAPWQPVAKLAHCAAAVVAVMQAVLLSRTMKAAASIWYADVCT
jgi:hypothetical protein